VGHDHDRVEALQRVAQLLDALRPGGIEGGRRLIEQQNLRLRGDRPCDAEPLLLPARQIQCAGVQPILHFFPQRRLL